MQLNNKKTGQIIKTKQVKDIGIYYDIFANKHCLDFNEVQESKNIGAIESDFVPTELQEWDKMKEEAALNKISQVETDFEFSDDIQNWITTMIQEQRFIRLTMTTDFANLVITGQIDYNLFVVINRKIQENNLRIKNNLQPFIFWNNGSVTAYFLKVDNEPNPENPINPNTGEHYSDQEIIMPFVYTQQNPDGKIFMETKII